LCYVFAKQEKVKLAVRAKEEEAAVRASALPPRPDFNSQSEE
jgi:hypothetical protein